VQPPKKKQKQPAKKKPEPTKLAWEMTKEETNMIVDKEVMDFFATVREKNSTGKPGCQKNEAHKQRLEAFICEREEIRRRKPPVEFKMDYERLVDKSYQKKRQGLPNSYIKQIPASTSGTTTNKNKEKQIDASTTDPTNVFAGLSAEHKKQLKTCLQKNWLMSLTSMNKQRCLLVVFLALKTYQRIKILYLDGALS
jgi:hypothetical protein